MRPSSVRERADGFSLIEMLVTMAIMALVTGPVLTAAARYVQRYSGQQYMVEMHQGLRTVQELLTQEVSQAGLHAMTPRTTLAPIAGSAIAQAIPVNDSASMFVGQRVSIDRGDSQEFVQLTAVAGNTVSGAFRKAHAAGATITEVGPFLTGIHPTSNATTLRIYGDIEAENELAFVEYRYVGATRQLTRAVTPVGAAMQQPAVVLLDDVVVNNGGAPLFQYRTRTSGGLTSIVEVIVTLTVETPQRDPVTGSLRQQRVTLSLTPRNTLAAFALIAVNGTTNLQNEPPGLPIPIQ